MKKQLIDLIHEIYIMNSDTYSVFIDISGHVDIVYFKGYNTGWYRNKDYSLYEEIRIAECKASDISRIRKAFKADMENSKKLLCDEKSRKADEVSRLKARLAQLEG